MLRGLRIQSFYPLIIIAACAAIAVVLTISRKAPEVVNRTSKGALVEYVEVVSGDGPIEIDAHGSVVPRLEAQITPEVSGKIVWTHSELFQGAFFKKDDVLLKIARDDYSIAVEMATSKVALAEKDLEVTKANARIAAQEWELMKQFSEGEKSEIATEITSRSQPNSLALYGPQLKSAQANLSAAKAELEKAKLNLSRTELKAPFDCYIQSKTAELGQYVNTGQNLASVIGTSSVEIVVPISAENARWVRAGLSEEMGARAEVFLRSGEETARWQGRVDRFLAEVDPRGRMHRAVVSVSNPYFDTEQGNQRRIIPLTVGSFAQVRITSSNLSGVTVIPRAALRANESVWLVDDKQTLRIRKVHPVRVTSDSVYVREGLEIGERVVLTTVSGATDGMKVRAAKVESDATQTRELESL
jgi:RND family efflux transporter MFP subunit